MAFDRTDTADLAALKSEVNTDPIAMGYDPAGPTNPLLKLLNDPANNVGGETSARVFDVLAMMDALVPAEYDAQQTVTDAANYVHTLVELGAYESIEPYKMKFRGLFAANSDTVTSLDAQTTALSRAEVLFGQGIIISREDWFAARDS
jgi:hypothetical protein